jgi:hypothetical protein
MSQLARPIAPAFARQAQAAVIMNTTDMTVHDGRTLPPRTTIGQLLRERDSSPVA